MVTFDVLGQNLLGLLLVGFWAFVAGFSLVGMLRVRLGLPGILLCGLAYWPVALYAFPFSHGLDFAAALALIGTVWMLVRQKARYTFGIHPLDRRALMILLVGCLAFSTLLFTNYVPPGMDASMHTTATRLIAANQGLPRSYAPFAPDLTFPAINIGLPALAAMAACCGCSPTGALMGAEVLTFSAFILAVYVLVRLWVRPTPAAVLAVFAVWGSRFAQETIEWGGVPTIASVALGLFATRLYIEILRRPTYANSLSLGLVVASMPLVHAVGAAAWLYIAAPVLAMYTISRRRLVRQAVGPVGVAVGITVGILGVYLLVGKIPADQRGIAWTRDWQLQFAPKGEGWKFLLEVPNYIKTSAGSAVLWPGILAMGILLWRRAFLKAGAVMLTMLALCIVVANSRYWVLPGSFLLYPERAVYWGTPLAVVAMAMAWRVLPGGLRHRRELQIGLVAILAVIACARHHHGYQRLVLRPVMNRSHWLALQWASQNLNPRAVLLESEYNSAGSYLPAVAGLATTGWHMPLFTNTLASEDLDQQQATHIFHTRLDVPLPQGKVIFQNNKVTILERTTARTERHVRQER